MQSSSDFSADDSVGSFPSVDCGAIVEAANEDDQVEALKNYVWGLLDKNAALYNMLRAKKWTKADIQVLVENIEEDIETILYDGVHKATYFGGPNGHDTHFASADHVHLCVAHHVVKIINDNNIAKTALQKSGGVARRHMRKNIFECMKRHPMDITTLRLIQGSLPPGV